MKIIVTGGSGFLGTALCKQLRLAGHEVKNLDLRTSATEQTEIIDIREQAQLSGMFVGADAVFHLAALIEAGESVKTPQSFIDTNLTGTLNVLEAMRQSGVKKILFSSSAAIYGEPLTTPITEDQRTLPISPYGMTKLAMEALISSYVYNYGFTGVALRYFNLYGPGENHQPETHAIPRFIDQLRHDHEITIWGDGLHQRDYLYIDDVVRAHLLALSLEGGYHYMNLASSKPSTVLDLVQHLAEILQKTPRIKHFPDRPGDPRILFASAEKAQKLLGWSAEIGIQEGLKRTVDWFLETQAK